MGNVGPGFECGDRLDPAGWAGSHVSLQGNHTHLQTTPTFTCSLEILLCHWLINQFYRFEELTVKMQPDNIVLSLDNCQGQQLQTGVQVMQVIQLLPPPSPHLWSVAALAALWWWMWQTGPLQQGPPGKWWWDWTPQTLPVLSNPALWRTPHALQAEALRDDGNSDS